MMVSEASAYCLCKTQCVSGSVIVATSDVLTSDLMLTGLLFVFPTFSILSGWKRIRFNS